MRRDTLGFRLIVASSVWIVGALVVAGFLLTLLFRAHIEGRFDRQIYAQLEELVAAAEAGADGKLKLNWTPADPRFVQPFSGWYWQISLRGEPILKSKSLWREQLPIDGPAIGQKPEHRELRDAESAAIRAVAQQVTLPDIASPFTFAVAGPRSDIEDDVKGFTSQLAATLALLAAALIGAVIVQIRYGLSPLRRVRSALADIRSGNAARLPSGFPGEIQPMIDDFNALLDHKERMIEQARTEAGDLAHALKNPLTVIRSEVSAIKGERGKVLRDYVRTVSAVIQRYVSRRRAAGASGVPGTAANVGAVLDDLVFTMARLYPGKEVTIEKRDQDALIFAGDAQDLEEMLGNLLDNGCKWAKKRVMLRASRERGRLQLVVEDDGPGMSAAALKTAIGRSRPPDTTTPGSGLGLRITYDLSQLCGGTLRLGKARGGGLRATLNLPAAEMPINPQPQAPRAVHS